VPRDSERGGSPAFGAAASASRIGSLAGAAAASPPSPSGSILSLSFSRSLLGMRGQESTKRTRGERREGERRDKEKFFFPNLSKAPPPRFKSEKRKSDFTFFLASLKKRKKVRSSVNTRRAIPCTMRHLRAIVPPFGVEEDVRWVEEDVPEEEETGSDKIAAAHADDDVGGGGGDAASTPTLEESEVLVPGVRRCLPPAPPPGSKPSILAILK